MYKVSPCPGASTRSQISANLDLGKKVPPLIGTHHTRLSFVGAFFLLRLCEMMTRSSPVFAGRSAEGSDGTDPRSFGGFVSKRNIFALRGGIGRTVFADMLDVAKGPRTPKIRPKSCALTSTGQATPGRAGSIIMLGLQFTKMRLRPILNNC